MDNQKDIKSLKQPARMGSRRRKPEKSSGPRWTGLFLFIMTLLISLFFYLKGGK